MFDFVMLTVRLAFYLLVVVAIFHMRIPLVTLITSSIVWQNATTRLRDDDLTVLSFTIYYVSGITWWHRESDFVTHEKWVECWILG